ncbi:MAG: NADPH:quinone oxidoreductase family protein [Steroidobacteraceae bacterium]|nr:NADPH:quinone oxidoreductase family protein [Steroidobacteraceae bacterium]MDW8258387.1 NADPH:quinone oxidoreductase family protein [Gammaproteobacteria bacterium]
MSSAVRQRWVAECTALTGPDGLQLVQRPQETLQTTSCRVRLLACGVNFPDLLLTRGQYQLRLQPPFVPGLEAAGCVVEIGSGVRGFHAGDLVVGNLAHGLYASEAVIPESQLVPAPRGFSPVEQACFYVAAFTAAHALIDRGQLRAGETLLVLGAGGGVGLAAVEIGCLLGARVIAAASSAAKLDAARIRGADALIDYRSQPLVQTVRALAPEGVDVIFDPVGGELFDQTMRLPAANGRLLIVGFASGSIGTVPANLPLLKGYSVVGVRAGEAARRDPSIAARIRERLHDWTQAGHLRPHVPHILPLGAAAEALRLLEQRQAIGRIALLPPES